MWATSEVLHLILSYGQTYFNCPCLQSADFVCLSADTFTYSIPDVMALEELPPIMVCSCWIKKQKEDKKTLSSNL